jgi:(p)ppGpp synthase/HD superfamily hydrolase
VATITHQDVGAAVGEALRRLPLKDMDPSLLYVTALHEGATLGVDVQRLGAAMQLAAYLHRADTRSRRRNLPVDSYVTHPFRLVARLVRYGCTDGGVLCAAALHDTVEDHPADLVALLGASGPEPPEPEPPAPSPDREVAVALLGGAFGPDVARIVSAVTNPPAPPDLPEDQRHQAYRAHVVEAINDPQVFLVKVADLVDNAGSLRYLADEDRRRRLARKYAPLVPLFVTALDTHRDVLPVEPEGLARIGEQLRNLDDLDRP